MSSLIVPNPDADYPPRWSTFLEHREKVRRSHAFTRLSDVFPFGNRYRLAHAFQGLELAGYSSSTKQGYAALTRVTLYYSAFEAFLRATGKTAEVFLRGLDPATCLYDIRAADVDGRFMRFVRMKLTKKSEQRAWDEFLRGRDCSPVILAAGVRHIFLHGDLTPSSNGTEPAICVAISERLTLALKRTMDREFAARVAILEQHP